MNQKIEEYSSSREKLTRYGGGFSPITISKAKGTYIYDIDGRAILDFAAGNMCSSLGHNHPAIVEAIREASENAIHLSSSMLSPPVLELAEALCAMLPPELQRVQFLSTGGESVEAALRMAKMHTGAFEIVGLTCSWHGMTGAANASTYAGGRKGYGPAVPGALAIPAPHAFHCPIRHCKGECDLTCLDFGLDHVERQSVGSMAAILVEPVLGAGGIVPLPHGYLTRLRQYCDDHDMVLILDEAQTALGRVGANFAFEEEGVTPDILALSKTLGAGLPLAATVTSAEIEEDCVRKGFLNYTSHTSDPFAAAAGLAALRVLAEENLVERTQEMSRYLLAGLEKLKQRHEVIGDVRGRGLLLGLEVVTDRQYRKPNYPLVRRISARALELGLHMAMLRDGGSGWRVAPPLTVSRDEIDSALSILDQAFKEELARQPVEQVS